MSEINSQTARTANYRLHQIALKVNASQNHQDDVELIDDCLKAFQALLEAEEAEEEDEDFVPFDVIIADDSEYQRSSIAVVRNDVDRFAVDFDYGGGRATAAIGQPTAKHVMKRTSVAPRLGRSDPRSRRRSCRPAPPRTSRLANSGPPSWRAFQLHSLGNRRAPCAFSTPTGSMSRSGTGTPAFARSTSN